MPEETLVPLIKKVAGDLQFLADRRQMGAIDSTILAVEVNARIDSLKTHITSFLGAQLKKEVL